MRSTEEFPYKRSFGAKNPTPAEYDANPGLPSENQRRILPVLVRFLQERFKIANCHVQAHFLHGKPTCPGYDTERWVLEHEDTARRQGEAFCYPVQLQSGATKPPFLKAPDQELARCKEYFQNTAKGRS